MFTRSRLPSFSTTGDWQQDGPRLVRWISDYFQSLEAKNVLSIRQAEIYVDQGLQFPATQVSSSDANNLDDYEEGSWTPVLTFSTPGNLSVAYSDQTGRYVKIGQFVFAPFRITTSTFTFTTASGSLEVTGLPYAASGLSVVGAATAWQGITKANYTDIVVNVGTGNTFATFFASGSGQNLAGVTAADMPTGGTVVLRGCACYLTA